MISNLRQRLDALAGQSIHDLLIESADDFHYLDPIDGSETSGQGIRIFFTNGSRIVLRLSGTGTEGATLRVYLDSFQNDPTMLSQDTQKALKPLIDAANELVGITRNTGRDQPDVIT